MGRSLILLLDHLVFYVLKYGSAHSNIPTSRSMKIRSIDLPLTNDATGLSRFGADRRFAQSLARGLSVLRVFKPGDGPLGNQELAKRTGLSKATVSRLTFTLAQLGYLHHVAAHEKYRLGSGVVALGNVANAGLPFIESAAEAMQKLADDLGSLVAIAVPDGPNMLMTHGWRPNSSPSIWLRLGTEIPIKQSAVGLAYLASVGTRELHHLVGNVLASTAEERQSTYAAVEDAKFSLKLNGFVTSFGRWTPKLYAAAVPFGSPLMGGPYVFFSGAASASIDKSYLSEVIGPQLAARVHQLPVE